RLRADAGDGPGLAIEIDAGLLETAPDERATSFDAHAHDRSELRTSGLFGPIPRLTRLRPRCLRRVSLRFLDRHRLGFFQEGLDRQLPEIGQGAPQSAVIPVPPREPLQPLRDGSRKALPDDARRVAGDDRIGIDVLGHYGAGPDHRAGADGAARKDDG